MDLFPLTSIAIQDVRIDVLPWVSCALSLLSFFWIGLRRDRKQLREELRSLPPAKRAEAIAYAIAPYVLGSGGVIVLLLSALWRPIDVRHHVLSEVRPTDGASIDVLGSTRLGIKSDKEHFEIRVSGEIVGPELDQLKRRFGGLKNVRVFVVVKEESRPSPTRDLHWVQSVQAGVLDDLGKYEVGAYLGGTGTKKATHHELFSIRVCIPDRGMNFDVFALQENALARKCLYLSEPLYITTLRGTDKSG